MTKFDRNMRVVANRGKYFDIGDEPDSPRLGRLRPGEAGAQPIDAVFQTATIVEHNRDLASRVAGLWGRWHPIDALRRVHGEPVVVAELIEEPCLAFDEAAEFVANRRVVHRLRVVLPVSEIGYQLAVERVVDVV